MVKAVVPPFVRSPYNYDVDVASDEAGLRCEDPSLAQQHQAEEADINVIVKRFGLTGQLPQVAMPPTYADFDDVFDFQSAQNMIIKANASFMALPAETRAAFNNDPAAFVAYVDAALEKGELHELRRMGLAAPEPAPTPSVGPKDPPTGEGAEAPAAEVKGRGGR